MKVSILTISILFSALFSNAQSFTFKVTPYTFQDGTRKSVTIEGIRAKIISNVDCNLSDSTFYRQFYIDFKTSAVESYGGLNTDTGKMASELSVNMNIPLSNAKALITEICRKLEFGTIAEKYAAAGQLAAGYGYVLKPLAEQLVIQQ
jgi:hypothetical protein